MEDISTTWSDQDKCTSNPIESLTSQLCNGDLWGIRNLLENNIVTIDMLRIALLSIRTYIAPQLRYFLLEIFETEPDIVMRLLNTTRTDEKYDANAFAETVFKYEHTGAIMSCLILYLPLDAFTQYIQMKNISLMSLISNLVGIRGNPDVLALIASDIPLNSSKDIKNIYRGLRNSISDTIRETCIQRLFDELRHDEHTQEVAIEILNHILSDYRVPHARSLTYLMTKMSENGYLISDLRLAALIFDLYAKQIDLSLIQSVIEPGIFEKAPTVKICRDRHMYSK